MRKLQQRSSSAIITLPKKHLERDDVLDRDGQVPEDQNAVVDRVGRREYLVRLVDDGEIPDLEEAEVIQRVAAKLALDEDHLGRVRIDG